MKLRERWKNLPGDVRMGFALTLCFILWLAITIVVGPTFLWVHSFLVVLALLAVALVLVFNLVFRTSRKQRVVPLLLVSGCLAILWLSTFGENLTDLHLIGRVYLAGGPGKINDWAQDLMRRRQPGLIGNDFIERDDIPDSIRSYLPGRVNVDGTIWSNLVRLRIELGGGFYHYGVVVYPKGTVLIQPSWWQRILGWPMEVEIYHE